MGDYAIDALESDLDRWADEDYPGIDTIHRPKPKLGDPCLCCDGHYVMRQNRKTEIYFLGCSNYPKCKSTINI